MREILFRGKRIDSGEWVVGIPWIFAPPVNKAVIVYAMGLVGEDDDTSRYCECHEVDPSTIGQYTGLTDENGKKIFEGDICIVKENGESDYATVGFEHGAFVIYPVNGKITEKTLWDVWYNDFSIEVIGNIHDNPELLDNSELLEDKS